MFDIELSIVSGTFNRMSYLKQMVNSVRQNMGIGIPYEIVLVDGGSTDGTLEWCKEQSDIVLIEQGQLLGAIKAFNEGLYAARGRYCIVGNDDVIYLEESLINALAFMQDNPDVGVGCFYQDRDHPGHWEVTRMPAILNNTAVMHVYGQICIVPKWLGDDVKWWGDFPDMRTYGGDNNLSSFVLEKGYKVTGIECACISDLKANDELRRINNEDVIAKYRRGGHPDSNAWGKHWTRRNGLCGAIICETPYKENPLECKTRFLYLPIYEPGHPILKTQKHGLRDALANYGLVYEYDWLDIASKNNGKYMIDYMLDIVDVWKPDVLLTQIHTPDEHMFNSASAHKIKQEFPDLIWVNWNGDYHPEDLLSPANIAMAKHFDLQCVVTTRVRDAYAKNGISWMYWQIGFESSYTEPDSNTSHHDVVLLATGYSGARQQLGRLLRSLKNVDVGIYGAWSGGIRTNGSNLYNFDEGQKLYRAARLSIGDNQWGNTAAGFVSNRLFQAMTSGGAMYMQQRVPELEDLLGLEDGKHYIVWEGFSDLRDKIHYWLDPKRESERADIALAGMEFIRENHSFDVRVKELMDVI